MKNAPIIDLSLRSARQMIADRGVIVGAMQIVWFRLVRPSVVGAVWASICIYTYRYLLPFNEAEMPIEQLIFYVTCISVMAGVLFTWLIAGRVVHPFAYRLRVSKMLRRSASLKARSGPAAAMMHARRPAGKQASRILIASHDANGLISGIEWTTHAAQQTRK
ncbi:Biofilm PGA synthesis auxiliary protein PgaD [Burkholderia sp. Ac-20353]|uniref:Biofilm PGA synthesis auxiliary protein PgaD n=1 Tax=Burkholderia sp. Ac-20353 TaxID=2703894 RepID=UPI00197B16F3|nr:Biofilm PGA synthesis auxiliary protein PgaD [Burkholderia sp. Ac-20353]MBN3788353.1 Biofilm PGA synthesis auxiliary protein PgaD [Burkholderia sp. Ac-20353]